MSISFIIAAYNIEQYLDECLHSVKQACHAEDEIIVVNDGSTDGTPGIIAAHARQFPAMQVVDKPNGGLSSARNAGLARARGDYIFFLDGDDALNPDALNLVRTELLRQAPDILVTDHQNWLDDGQGALQPSLTRSHPPGMLTQDPARQLTETLEDGIPCVWARLFKRTLFDTLPAKPFPEWSMYDDLPTTPHLVAVAHSMLYLPVPLVKYRCRPGSLTKLRTPRSCTDMVKAAIEAARSIKRLPYDAQLETTADAMMVRKLMEAIKQGRELDKPTIGIYRDMVDMVLGSLSRRTDALLDHLTHTSKPGDRNVSRHLKFALRWRAGYVALQAGEGWYKSRRHKARLRKLARA